MKNFATTLISIPQKSLPIPVIGEVISTIINYSSRKKEMEYQYNHASAKMEKEYLLEKKKIEANFQAFKLMSKTYAKHSKHSHKERMKLLDMMSGITALIAGISNAELQSQLNRQFNSLLGEYQSNIQNNMHVLEFSNQNLLGGA